MVVELPAVMVASLVVSAGVMMTAGVLQLVPEFQESSAWSWQPLVEPLPLRKAATWSSRPVTVSASLAVGLGTWEPVCAGLVPAMRPNVLHCCADPVVVAETAYALLFARSAFWGVVQTVLGRAVCMCQPVSPVVVDTFVFVCVARNSLTP